MDGEVIFLQLFNVGNKIELEGVESLFHGTRYKINIKSKDTPSYIDIPTPLILEIIHQPEILSDKVEVIKFQIKFYADGLISCILRISYKNIPLIELNSIKTLKINFENKEIKIRHFISKNFNHYYEKIKEFIDKRIYNFDPPENKKYTIYTITNNLGDVTQFIKENDQYLASLLMGENPELDLHLNQIKDTLNHSFSFLKNDKIILDFDRCLIIDPNKDYEDLLLIVEMTNYQLLELRTLDMVLDERFNVAEQDIRKIFFKKRNLWRKLKKRLRWLFKLRLDMILLLENIENVSKIIGDYYLAQIYVHLGEIFQLDQWSISIRHRLSLLDEIYSSAKSDFSERIFLLIEILFVIIFSWEFIFFIISFF